VVNNIPDNTIGEVNTKDNWGNTVIIKHNDYLYSKLSHLKFQSVEVKTSDSVKKGQMIGRCGNSGRSPYPHLHFQFQANPYVGSTTIDYPFGHYLLKESSGYSLKSFDFPQKDQVLANPSKNEVLNKALHFIPGRRIKITVEVDSEKIRWKKLAGEYEWVAETDVFNTTLLRCEKHNDRAYLYNQGDMHFFTNFIGKKYSPLFWFYVSLFKVPMGFQAGSRIQDSLPVHQLFGGIMKYLQDFVAPLFLFLKAEYELTLKETGDILSSDSVKMEAEITKKIAGRKIKVCTSKIDITQKGDFEISIETDEAKLKMTCKNE